MSFVAFMFLSLVWPLFGLFVVLWLRLVTDLRQVRCRLALRPFVLCCLFFFFQAEDGIRDWSVTGVQTCALPISAAPRVAIAGTSGKSTIVGMLGWLLREGGVKATVLGGADFVGEGTGGCFVAGPAEGPAVAEACESDGTLVGYHPAIGLIHNVSRDHDELSALRPQFTAFARNCGRLLVGADCPDAAALGRRFKAATYGVTQDADARLRVPSVGPRRARGVLRHGRGDLG